MCINLLSIRPLPVLVAACREFPPNKIETLSCTSEVVSQVLTKGWGGQEIDFKMEQLKYRYKIIGLCCAGDTKQNQQKNCLAIHQ